MKLNFKYILFLLCVVFFSCTEDADFSNPLDDENNPDFIPPDTFIHNDLNNSIISEDNVVITWSGNELIVDYSYNFNGQGWSSWDTDTSLALSYLDEDVYTFEVKGRYVTGLEDETPDLALFEIDAVSGPGLRIFPLYLNISGDDMVSLYLEEVENVSFGAITLDVVSQSNNCNDISISSIVEGNALSDDGISPNIFIYDSNQNQHTINFGLTDVNGVSGTGELAKIYLTNSDNCNDEVILQINVENSELRDYDDNEIIILDSANGVIEEDE